MPESDPIMTVAAAAVPFWVQMVGYLVGFAAGFGILTRLMPCNPGRGWWKDLRAAATDAVYWLVVPLSNIRRGPFSWSSTIIAIVTHMVCVGLPISLMVSRYSRQSS